MEQPEGARQLGDAGLTLDLAGLPHRFKGQGSPLRALAKAIEQVKYSSLRLAQIVWCNVGQAMLRKSNPRHVLTKLIFGSVNCLYEPHEHKVVATV